MLGTNNYAKKLGKSGIIYWRYSKFSGFLMLISKKITFDFLDNANSLSLLL